MKSRIILLLLLLVVTNTQLQEGDLGFDPDSGVLQMWYMGWWANVCGDTFQENNAQVACRQLAKQNHATSVKLASFEHSTTCSSNTVTFVYGDVQCAGWENDLRHCGTSTQIGLSGCRNDACLMLVCNFQFGEEGQDNHQNHTNSHNGLETNNNLRLTPHGQLQVYNNGWGNVCGLTFGEIEGQVACKQLGLQTGSHGQLVSYNSQFCDYQLFLLGQFTCSGSEVTLQSCSGYDATGATCDLSQCVSLQCEFDYRGNPSGSSSSTFSASGLNNIPNVQAGGVTSNSASSQQNHTDGEVHPQTDALSAQNPSQNNTTAVGDGYVDYSLYDQINFQTPNPNVRLLGLQSILQVKYNNEWRGICQNGFTYENANVVCRSLGMGFAMNIEYNILYEGQEDFWIDGLFCEGYENSIYSCNRNRWGVENCSQYDHVGVKCSDAWNSNHGMDSADFYTNQQAAMDAHFDGATQSQNNTETSEAAYNATYYDNQTQTADVQSPHGGLQFSNDISYYDYDGEEYYPLSGPWVYVDGEYYQIDQFNNLVQNGRQQPGSVDGEGHKVDGERHPFTFQYVDGPYFTYDGEYYYLDEQNYVYESTHHAIYYEPSGPTPEELAEQQQQYQTQYSETFNQTQYSRQVYNTTDGEFTVSGPYVFVDGEYIPNVEVNERLADGEITYEALYQEGAAGPYFQINGDYYSYQELQHESISYDDQEGEDGYYRNTDGEVSLHPQQSHYTQYHPQYNIKFGFNNTVLVYDEQFGWGGVCDDGFSLKNAEVVCTQLGLGKPLSFSSGEFIQDVSYFILDDVQCQGTEHSLFDCQHSPVGVNDCYPWEYVRVECDGNQHTNKGIRLVSARNILEVGQNGEWKGVCDNNFDTNDAEVACRELGQGHPIFWSSVSRQDYTPGFWLDELECSGFEHSLFDCPHKDSKSIECENGKYISLICEQNAPNIRLSSSKAPDVPVLEVYVNDQWAGVCDDSFGQKEALVACRHLGYNSVKNFQTSVFNSNDFYWLDEVKCTGTEKSIFDCKSNSMGQEDCGTYEHVSLECFNDRDIKQNKGNVISVQYDGQWKGICDDKFSSREADVVCRQLGFSSGAANFSTNVSWKGHNDFSYANFNCSGSEQSLFDCPSTTSSQTYCDETQHIEVTCLEQIEEITLIQIAQKNKYFKAQQEKLQQLEKSKEKVPSQQNKEPKKVKETATPVKQQKTLNENNAPLKKNKSKMNNHKVQLLQVVFE